MLLVFIGLVAVLLGGCMQAVMPRLEPLSLPLSLEQVQEEGQTEWRSNPCANLVNFLAFLRIHEPRKYELASFSVSPEQLAALLVETVKEQKQWRVYTLRKRQGSPAWQVPLTPPWGGIGPAYYVEIQSGEAGQGSRLRVGEGTFYLHPELFPALRTQVRAYLTGQGVPSKERQERSARIYTSTRRLRELLDQQERGLLTEEEYRQRLQAIINGL